MTYTDHRLVRAKMTLDRLHIKKENHKQRLNQEELQNPTTRARFAVSFEMKIMGAEENRTEEQNINAQKQWNNIVEANHKSAKEILGKRQPKSARAIRQAEENIPTNQLIDRRREEERAETGAEQSDEGNTQ